MSVPAETELAAMLVPSCASEKAAAMKKTPARFLEPPSSRIKPRRSSGSQTGPVSGYRAAEEEETMMPMKDVKAKPMGMVQSCDQRASLGLPAKREKSGELTMRVAKLAIELMMPLTNSQANSLPSSLVGCLTTGPRPPARLMVQPKKAKPLELSVSPAK